MNKKGDVMDIAYAMVFIFIGAVVFFISTFSYDKFADQALNTSVINSSNVTKTSIEQGRENTEKFDYIIFVLLIAFVLAIIITGWLVGGNPIFAFIYFIVLVILVAVSAIFSFTWNKLTTTALYGTLVADKFPAIDFILSNFPVFIAVIGFIGLMVMFAKPALQQ